MTNCESTERRTRVLPPHRRRLLSVEMKDTENNRLITQTLHLFLKWATRIHPSDVELTSQNLIEGVALAELLVSFSNDHFGDLLDHLSTNSDESGSGLIRKVELIREQLRLFYADKSARPLDEATSFLAPASEIVERDEDSLMRLMIVIYGVAASLNHMSNKDFAELLESSSTEIQQFTNEMVKEFANELSGNGRADTTQENNELRSKLKQARIEVANLKDEKAKLEFELSNKEIELTKYAEMNAMSQEVEMKLERLEQVQEQLRIAEDHCSKLEIRVGELTAREETLSKELAKIRETLKSTEDELREVRDNKAAVEHRLSISTARVSEMEQKFARLQESTKEKPSERDHAALKDRYSKMLKRNSELEQQCQSLDSYKMLLENHKAQLEQVKSEKETVLNDLYTEQQRTRELKLRLREMENAKLLTRTENAEPVTPTSLHDELSKTSSFDYGDINEEMVNLKVEVSSLQSEKKGLQEELARTKAHVESEKERSGAVLAKARLESEQLALKHETLQNEFMRQKQELDSVSGKCKRMEDERTTMQNQIAELELAVKRAGYLISEYVFQNDDGTSTGMTGSECVQLRAEVQRLQEQLQSHRIQADAYRHIATEEQRLITAEWFDQALNYVQQKHLAPMCASSHSETESTNNAYEPYSPHLSNMQQAIMSSRSTTFPQDLAASTSTGGTDSMSSSIEANNRGIFHRLTSSFLRQQHDTQLNRCMNNLNKLRFNNVKYAYGMLHNCDMFLFDIDDGKTWPRVLRNAKAYENSTTPPDCDCSSVDFAFDYSPETGEVSAIRIVHFHSGFAEVLNIVELPIYHRVGLQQRVLPRRTFDNFEKAAYTIHENILGFTCQYLSDVIVGAMFLETDDLLTECMMNIRSVNYTPIVMGYIQEDSVFSRSFNAVRNPTFWKKVENYFKKFYLEYWHLFWLLCTCAVLLTAPLLILCGRLYHQMIVSAARFNIALDALIATNCDVLEHIRERQKLLSDSGFESISLNDVNVEDDQLRVKAEMLYRMQFGKQSPTAIEHQQSSTQTSTQVTKN